MKYGAVFIIVLVVFVTMGSRGDQVEMENGDHYTGKIVSMTAENVMLDSPVLGRISLPRSKLVSLTMGTPRVAPVTNRLSSSLIMTNAHKDYTAILAQLGANTNLADQVRQQFLAGAGPAANAKFDELMSEVVSNKFDLTHLREEAKKAADQIRSVKESGGDAGQFDSYLAILDGFLKESAHTNVIIPTVPNPTNGPTARAP